MTTETIEGVVADTSPDLPEPSFKEQTARFARIDAFASALLDWVKKERPAQFRRMPAEAARTDSKTFNVRIGDEVAATMTITEPQAKIVVSDPDALTDWLMDHHPTEVETITQPRPAFVKLLTDKMTTGFGLDEDGIVILKDTGEVVPGLRRNPAPAPSSFSTRWKSPDLKQAVLDDVLAAVAPALGLELEEAGR